MKQMAIEYIKYLIKVNNGAHPILLILKKHGFIEFKYHWEIDEYKDANILFPNNNNDYYIFIWFKQ